MGQELDAVIAQIARLLREDQIAYDDLTALIDAGATLRADDLSALLGRLDAIQRVLHAGRQRHEQRAAQAASRASAQGRG